MIKTLLMTLASVYLHGNRFRRCSHGPPYLSLYRLPWCSGHLVAMSWVTGVCNCCSARVELIIGVCLLMIRVQASALRH